MACFRYPCGLVFTGGFRGAPHHLWSPRSAPPHPHQIKSHRSAPLSSPPISHAPAVTPLTLSSQTSLISLTERSAFHLFFSLSHTIHPLIHALSSVIMTLCSVIHFLQSRRHTHYPLIHALSSVIMTICSVILFFTITPSHSLPSHSHFFTDLNKKDNHHQVPTLVISTILGWVGLGRLGRFG